MSSAHQPLQHWVPEWHFHTGDRSWPKKALSQDKSQGHQAASFPGENRAKQHNSPKNVPKMSGLSPQVLLHWRSHRASSTTAQRWSLVVQVGTGLLRDVCLLVGPLDWEKAPPRGVKHQEEASQGRGKAAGDGSWRNKRTFHQIFAPHPPPGSRTGGFTGGKTLRCPHHTQPEGWVGAADTGRRTSVHQPAQLGFTLSCMGTW